MKVKFQSGEIREINRTDDGFTCDCGKVFKHPGSVHNHAKKCHGVELNDSTELTGNASRVSDMTNEHENTMTTDLSDCIGI